MPRKKTQNRTNEKIIQPPPEQRDEKVKYSVILFADIMGASEVSNHTTPEDYYKFVKAFSETFKNVCIDYVHVWDPTNSNYMFEARGDEGLLMMFPNDEGNRQRALGKAVNVALHIALALKRRWLKSKTNRDRISSHLLPIDVGIGIHVGQTFIAEIVEKAKDETKNPKGWEPEGYAINLAKRVESYSRNGKYTNVFVSEAAHGYWSDMPDEKLFIFDERQVMQPKGISRNIAVFEVKHHFLTANWTELLKNGEGERSYIFTGEKEIDMQVFLAAKIVNPTNIWIAEECIRAVLLTKFLELSEKNEDTKENLKDAYKPAIDIAANLANSTLRDWGILCIYGLIEGEYCDFESERKRYEQAINMAPMRPEPYWYRGLSYSYEVFFAIDGKKRQITWKELSDELKELVQKALDDFRDAHDRSYNSAWIPYDYGCELINWEREENEKKKGKNLILLACTLLPMEVAHDIKSQPYLEKLTRDSDIQEILKKTPSL